MRRGHLNRIFHSLYETLARSAEPLTVSRAGMAALLVGAAGLGATQSDIITFPKSRMQQSIPSAVTTTPLSGALSPYFIADAVAKALPAVVNVALSSGSGALNSISSSGSGFLVSSDGQIWTNAHVIADILTANTSSPGQKTISITLQDGRFFKADLVAFDLISDIAILKVNATTPLPHVRLGSSSRLRVGEWVVALGSPLHLQNSCTAGIVSSVDRKAVELGLAGARMDFFIQTDAAINRGSSGGPLVNLLGEVIGISAMKALAADGISFGIPIDAASEIVHQLLTKGRVVRPYIGVKLLQLNAHSAAELKKKEGLLIPHVYGGSPAEKAGLIIGDVILGFGNGKSSGQSKTTTTELIKALSENIGKKLDIYIDRDGESMTVTVVAEEAGPPG